MVELIIVFREVLEASLIIGILYTFLNQLNQKESIKMLWQGVLAALIASFLGSILFQKISGGFTGQAEKLFEGFIMVIASVFLGTMIVWMAKNKNISDELKHKASDVLKGNNVKYGIFGLAFISVFREGIETILFLYGTMMKQGNLSFSLSLLGAFLGLGIGYLIFIQGKKLPLKTFFNISSILLIFVASGMMAYGVHELESAGIIPNYGRLWDINPEIFSDGTYPLLHDKGMIGSLFKGLFGYNGDPSFIELFSWILTLSLLFYSWNRFSKNN